MFADFGGGRCFEKGAECYGKKIGFFHGHEAIILGRVQ